MTACATSKGLHSEEGITKLIVGGVVEVRYVKWELKATWEEEELKPLRRH